ncbi:MAG: sigma-70 region 4 domain-containing protein [Tannerellaceae bacterium]|jgi:DNA-binding CsgD family transcriptional regulator|nr:sigma-70 region 4 domain-containing protein [Tannerellaceae bacterium]
MLLFFPVISYITTLTMYAAVDIPLVPPVHLKKYGIHDYNAASQNWDLSISPEGILYVGNNSGFLTFDGNNWMNYELPDRSAVLRVKWVNDTVYTQSETSAGYWLPNGMGRLDYHPLDSLPAHAGFADPLEGLPPTLSEEIQQQKPSAFATIDSMHIIGTLAHGIYVTNEKADRILLHFSTLMGLPNNIVHALCVQDSFSVWAAFDDGLAKIYFLPAFRLLGTRNHIGMLQDVAVHEDMLYIRTNTNYYKRKPASGDAFTPVTEQEALPCFSSDRQKEERSVSDLIGDSIEDPELLYMERAYPISARRYWLTGKNEALLVAEEANRMRISYRILFDNYNLNLVRKGKQIVSFNDSLHIVSTIQGVLLINTNLLPEALSNKGLPFRFTRIQYKDSKGVHALNPRSEKIYLPHDFHELTIYAGSSVFDPNSQISYKIADVSPDWSDWQNDGKITLLQLPEHEYKLSVRKHTGQGDFPEITMHIHVCPPWYKTFWAYLCYALLLGSLTGINTYSYLKKQKRKEAYLLSVERQKMQQLKNEMLEAELENKKNELIKQTSIFTRKGMIMNTLLEELERQKKILGERYPSTLYIRMRSLMEKVLNDHGDWIAFEAYFNSAHQNFTERFRQQYADITTGDLRICCLLRMNLSTKEIASILNVSVRAVELRRYRLRKRIGLDSDTNLVDFLMNF